MKSQPQFLFDECFGRPIVTQLAEFVANDPTGDHPIIKHLLDLYDQGAQDDFWIPKCSQEGWVVISSDRAKQQSGHRPKLPIICQHYQVTHVLISSTIHAMKSFDKGRIIISLWPELLKTPLAPRGTRYSLRMTSGGHPTLILVSSPASTESEDPEDPDNFRKTLF